MTTAQASNLTVTSPIIAPESPAALRPRHPLRRLVQAQVVTPVLNLLRMGASPERLAWSFAAGAVIGLNPIVGSTTLLCLGVALAFRLNLIASQLANHLCFPIQLALMLAWLRAGQILFRTSAPPLDAADLLHAMRLHPLSATQALWTWEWHAIVVWLLASAILTPLLAAALHPILRRLLISLHPA